MTEFRVKHLKDVTLLLDGAMLEAAWDALIKIEMISLERHRGFVISIISAEKGAKVTLRHFGPPACKCDAIEQS